MWILIDVLVYILEMAFYVVALTGASVIVNITYSALGGELPGFAIAALTLYFLLSILVAWGISFVHFQDWSHNTFPKNKKLFIAVSVILAIVVVGLAYLVLRPSAWLNG